MKTWNQEKQKILNSSLSKNILGKRLDWFVRRLNSSKSKRVTIKNMSTELIFVIRAVKERMEKFKLTKRYIKNVNSYFNYLQGGINIATISRKRYYSMKNDIPEIKIGKITGIDSLMNTIFELTDRYINGNTDVSQEDIGARLDVLFRAGSILLKAYEQETLRMHTINETASIITDRDRLFLEAAVVTGDEDEIKRVINNDNLKQVTDKLL